MAAVEVSIGPRDFNVHRQGCSGCVALEAAADARVGRPIDCSASRTASTACESEIPGAVLNDNVTAANCD